MRVGGRRTEASSVVCLQLQDRTSTQKEDITHCLCAAYAVTSSCFSTFTPCPCMSKPAVTDSMTQGCKGQQRLCFALLDVRLYLLQSCQGYAAEVDIGISDSSPRPRIRLSQLLHPNVNTHMDTRWYTSGSRLPFLFGFREVSCTHLKLFWICSECPMWMLHRDMWHPVG